MRAMDYHPCDETHDPTRRSWVTSANKPGCEFPIQNLPFGAFCLADSDTARIGVAIGDEVVDLAQFQQVGLLQGLEPAVAAAIASCSLTQLMSLGRPASRTVRRRLSDLLTQGNANEEKARGCMVSMRDITMRLPDPISGFTDFATSLEHVRRLGRMFNPNGQIRDNFWHLPAAYHGRNSTLVVSGTACRRPLGQFRPKGESAPVFGPTRQLDAELELGFYLGTGNALGEPITMADAEAHIFGMVLVNDWSARDLQSWEAQPLGPFLGKSFLTSVSPWIVTMDALAPFRVAAARSAEDPPLMPYLDRRADREAGGFRIQMELALRSEKMRQQNLPEHTFCSSSFAKHYWTPAQMLVHHASNGCRMQTGDLLATGTVSGSEDSEVGCLLERVAAGLPPIELPTSERRQFIEDGDEVILRGRCARDGFVSIGFGECCSLVSQALDADIFTKPSA